jgi:hypothetical protein
MKRSVSWMSYAPSGSKRNRRRRRRRRRRMRRCRRRRRGRNQPGSEAEWWGYTSTPRRLHSVALNSLSTGPTYL